MNFLVYFTCVSSSEICGFPYRLLTEPCGGSCQKCDSDKIRDTGENMYTIYSVEMSLEVL